MRGLKRTHNMVADNIITIVIPAKNEENRIGHCLKAIHEANRDAYSLELIVVDNGSDDKTQDVALNGGAKVLCKRNGNIGSLRNIGTKAASGQYIGFIDADVIIHKDWLKEAMRFIDNPQIGCVTGRIDVPNNSTWIENIWAYQRDICRKLAEVKWASSMNMIFRKNVYESIGGFDESIKTGEDVELSGRLTRKGFRILYNDNMSVIHNGEAKTLGQFIKKERWRGYSDLDLLIMGGLRVSNLRNGIQPLFFLGSAFNLIMGIVVQSWTIIFLSCMSLCLLPVIRTYVVIKKTGTMKYADRLFFIWFVYYIARTLGTIDNIIDKIRLVFSRRA